MNRQLDKEEAASLVRHHHLHHGGEGARGGVEVGTVEHPVHHLLLLHLNIPARCPLVLLLTRHVGCPC